MAAPPRRPGRATPGRPPRAPRTLSAVTVTPERPGPPPSRGRVVVAKVGLDGHDRGVKVVARMLRDAGFEVIYLGLRQTPDMVAAAAEQEDADVVGLSLHSGGHLTLAPAVVDALARRGLDVPVLVGGIVPARDVEVLRSRGVQAVLAPGASEAEVVAAVDRAVASRAGR